MKYLKKILYVIFPLILLLGIFNFTSPPASWQQASTLQILCVFLPLLLFFSLFVNTFLNHYLKSFAIGICLMLLVVIQALNQLNIFLIICVLLVAALLFYFIPQKDLKGEPRIPKLKRFGLKK